MGYYCTDVSTDKQETRRLTAQATTLTQRVGVQWQLDSGFGAGVLGINIVLELCRTRALQPVLLVPPGRIAIDPLSASQLKWAVQRRASGSNSSRVDFPVLYTTGNDFQHNIVVDTSSARYAIMAFENTHFTRGAHERNVFTRVFTESKWNGRILRARGFKNVVDWTQGVDRSVFHPAPRRGTFGDRFAIYSGGKLEYRKAQDVVVQAFKAFARKRDDALLVAAWNNPWTDHALTINRSPLTNPLPLDADGRPDVQQWLLSEGLKPEQFVVLDYIPNSMTPAVLRECDVALFPNRAEGGTNLVAMECLACGVPSVLAANTGQLDLVETVPCYVLEDQREIPNLTGDYHTEGWGESSVDEVVERLDQVYVDRDAARSTGVAAAEAMEDWSWRNRVAALAETVRATQETSDR